MMEQVGSKLLVHWEGTKKAFRSNFNFLEPIAWDKSAYQKHLENLDLVSPDRLFGHEGGREWVLWMLLPRIVPAGRSLVCGFSFRGCPPGKEGQRLMPYFCVGPPLSVLGWKGNITNGVEVLKATKRDYGKAAILPLALRAPWGEVVACSSYPPLDSAMRSEAWLRPIFGWYSSIQRCTPQKVNPPTLAGSSKWGVLTVPYDAGVPQSAYIAIFRELMGLVADLEARFGVLDAPGALSPQVIRTSAGLTPAALCPKCGNLAAIHVIHDLFGAPLNERTTCCKALVYQQR